MRAPATNPDNWLGRALGDMGLEPKASPLSIIRRTSNRVAAAAPIAAPNGALAFGQS